SGDAPRLGGLHLLDAREPREVANDRTRDHVLQGELDSMLSGADDEVHRLERTATETEIAILGTHSAFESQILLNQPAQLRIHGTRIRGVSCRLDIDMHILP